MARLDENAVTLTGPRSGATSSDFFGPPPLLLGEDRAAYDAFLAQAYAAEKPRDILEKILINEFVGITWDLLRLRRYKVHLQNNRVADGLGGVTRLPFDELNELEKDWRDGKRRARNFVERHLAATSQTMEHVAAEALEQNLELFEQLDRKIAALEARSRATMREFDRRRTVTVMPVRETVPQVESLDRRPPAVPKTERAA